MPQLDFISYISQVFWLLLSFTFLYTFFLSYVLPPIFVTLRYRTSFFARVAKKRTMSTRAKLTRSFLMFFFSNLHFFKVISANSKFRQELEVAYTKVNSVQDLGLVYKANSLERDVLLSFFQTANMSSTRLSPIFFSDSGKNFLISDRAHLDSVFEALDTLQKNELSNLSDWSFLTDDFGVNLCENTCTPSYLCKVCGSFNITKASSN